MKTVSGTITLVQEHRFQLRDEHGKHRLFILAHNAAQEWSDLKRLEKSNCHVRVLYTDSDNLLAATAHDVQQQENVIH